MDADDYDNFWKMAILFLHACFVVEYRQIRYDRVYKYEDQNAVDHVEHAQALSLRIFL